MLERLGLRFPDRELEAEFRRYFLFKNLPLDRASLFAAGCLFYLFFLWDRAIDPVHWETPHAIRGLAVLPVLWAAGVLLGTRAAQNRYEVLLTGLGVFCNLALSLIYCLLDGGFDFGSAGPLLVSMWLFAVFRLRLPYLLWYSGLSAVCFFTLQIWSGQYREGMLLVNALSVGSALVLGLWGAALREAANREAFVAGRELAASREKIADLLHSVLPEEIVERIARGDTAIADAYGEVSIVFADLVGFTELSRKISPVKLVEILNALFSTFDDAAERAGIERIKTIGDAYMAVGGLSQRGGAPDHAERAAMFALDIGDAVRDLSARLGFPLDIRVGLHIGPVVAGVIGTKRPAFDCWGETVNLASRLESSASPGGILMSEAAYWSLKDKFDVEVIEDINLKGIGPQKVFMLKCRSANSEIARMDEGALRTVAP